MLIRICQATQLILSGFCFAALGVLGYQWIYEGYGLNPLACMGAGALLALLNIFTLK